MDSWLSKQTYEFINEGPKSIFVVDLSNYGNIYMVIQAAT